MRTTRSVGEHETDFRGRGENFGGIGWTRRPGRKRVKVGGLPPAGTNRAHRQRRDSANQWRGGGGRYETVCRHEPEQRKVDQTW